VAERALADGAAVPSPGARPGGVPGLAVDAGEERCARSPGAVDALVAGARRDRREITLQIGRPIAHSPGEVRGLEERARHMLAVAPEALADVGGRRQDRFTRLIRREPLGLVLVIAPWNYPYLTAVNAIFRRSPPATRCS
jgi:acyl-CoA reductase-like NAD-dependent aldehyde dehydrogenase